MLKYIRIPLSECDVDLVRGDLRVRFKGIDITDIIADDYAELQEYAERALDDAQYMEDRDAMHAA